MIRIELDPEKRNWEYDGDGQKIYKPEVGFPMKTIVNETEKKKWNGIEEPYYVDLP